LDLVLLKICHGRRVDFGLKKLQPFYRKKRSAQVAVTEN
jgi:hypothetical protein